ncbi:MAG: hypothetical protein ACYTX0_49865, partial [Nostoc sp.]
SSYIYSLVLRTLVADAIVITRSDLHLAGAEGGVFRDMINNVFALAIAIKWAECDVYDGH